MKKILLMIFASAVTIGLLGCNYYDLDDAFGEAYDRAMYGNWCGPGRSGPDAPIDSLDELCKAHDECYGTEIPFEDYAACTPTAAAKIVCDQAFVTGMEALTSDSDSWDDGGGVGSGSPPAGLKAEAEQYWRDALLIFGSCASIATTP